MRLFTVVSWQQRYLARLIDITLSKGLQIQLAKQEGEEQHALELMSCLYHIFTSPHIPHHTCSHGRPLTCAVLFLLLAYSCPVPALFTFPSMKQYCARISCHDIISAHALATHPKSFNLASSNAFKNGGSALECTFHSNIS